MPRKGDARSACLVCLARRRAGDPWCGCYCPACRETLDRLSAMNRGAGRQKGLVACPDRAARIERYRAIVSAGIRLFEATPGVCSESGVDVIC